MDEVMQAETQPEAREPQPLPGSPGRIRTNVQELESRALVPDRTEKLENARVMPEFLREMYPGVTQQASRTAFEKMFVDAFRDSTIAADIAVSGRVAGSVWALAELISRYDVSYQEAGKLVFGAALDFEQQNPGMRKKIISVKFKDEPERIETGKSATRYRQAAQRHYFLARIQCQAPVGKKDPNWPVSASVNGTEYGTPVEALAAGNTLTAVHDCFRMAWKLPVEKMEDLPEKTRGAAKAGREQIKRLFVTARRYDESKGGEVRARIPVAESQQASLGVIEGLLSKWTWNEKQAKAFVAAMRFEADGLKPLSAIIAPSDTDAAKQD